MKTIISLFITTLLCAQAQATDPTALVKRQQAKDLYAKRETLANVDQAITILHQAVAEAQSADLKYDIMIDLVQNQYFRGTRVAGDAAKMVEFEKAYNLAAQAKKMNDEYADAYYMYGIALARWAEAKGIVASLSRKQELIDHMEGAMQRDARNGKSGDTLDAYGPDRVLGRMFFKLPGFAGGSFDKSLKHLTRSYTNGKDNSLNWVYYAETLLDGKPEQKATACAALKDLLAKDPKTFNLERVLETAEEFQQAAELQKKGCR